MSKFFSKSAPSNTKSTFNNSTKNLTSPTATPKQNSSPFIFLGYSYHPKTSTAKFSYQGPDKTKYIEKITFASSTPTDKTTKKLLDRALFLAFILIGTSYYKSHPTPHIKLKYPLDEFQAYFFTTVYTHGLSQFIYENHLSPAILPKFNSTPSPSTTTSSTITPTLTIAHPQASSKTSSITLSINNASPLPYSKTGILSLQSGGKDSLLTAALLAKNRHSYAAWYLSSGKTYPKVLQNLPGDSHLLLATRYLDLKNLQKSHGLTGHVPITYINQSLALIEAILQGKNFVLTSIGQEGNEPHAYLEDLPINHQWSKTYPAEELFNTYVHNYLSKDIHIGSLLRAFTEYEISRLFIKHCWQNYAHQFSSCNLANYRQPTTKNPSTKSLAYPPKFFLKPRLSPILKRSTSRKLQPTSLSWCGNCPKCANTFLLFAPHLKPKELTPLFNRQDLFTKPSLINDYKGLLGIDNHQKPFECIAEIDELRLAYHHRQPGYANLPFTIPTSNFNPRRSHPHNPLLFSLIA